MIQLPTIIPYKPNDTLNIAELVTIGSSLQNEFEIQAGNYAWATGVMAEAKAAVRQLKAELELLDAQLTNKIRKKFGGVLKVNEVRALVVSSTKYRNKNVSLRKAQKTEDYVSGFVKALEQKKDMLVQLGAASRAEYDPEVRLMQKRKHLKILKK